MTEKDNEKIIEKRKELIFLYSVKDANPNGDPDDENRPRTDLNGYNIVSDVRLKRTIRDYLIDNGESVIIRRKYTNENKVKNIEGLITDFLQKEITREKILDKIPKEFIDVRLFGLMAAVENASCAITGPVQFAIGKSLNIPDISTHSITSVMAAGTGKGGGAMGSFHVVDYSLIAFEGVVCPNLAKISKLTHSDVCKLFKAIWMGTKTINTRSKFNHIPQLLISVNSNNSEFLIGDLAYRLKIDGEKPNFRIKLDDFISRISKFAEDGKSQIESISYCQDPDLILSFDGKEDTFENIIAKIKIPVEKMTFNCGAK